MARSCDKPAPFEMTPTPKRSEVTVDAPPTREVETVELVFGPRGGFKGFKRTITVEPVKPRIAK